MNDSVSDQAGLKDALIPAASTRMHLFSRAMESHILFPAIAILGLAAIWWTTLNTINSERAAAEESVALSTHYLTEIYESQMLRALREIDKTLKIVKYASYAWDTKDVLPKLKARDLLPPDLLFVIKMTNSKGEVVASTRPLTMANVASQDVFQQQRQSDVFSISRPQRDPASGTWKLNFSHRLDTPDGGFAGIVMLSVDADYFVSGFESTRLGKHGMLGLLGTDGIFRVSRSGDIVSAGGRANLTPLLMHPMSPEDETASTMSKEARASINPWDGVRRYTMAHTLYGFPLAVVVGLSADEQLAATRQNKQVYLWWATASSLLLILILAVLGYMSRQLALSRMRAIEEQAANAEHVEYLAFHDGLTTLPNRSLFSKLLDQSIKQAHRYNRQLAVLFFDLDHFKNINDTLGHEGGDHLLQEVATRVKACLRDSDTVARIGGDEFVALLPELDEEKYVATVAQKILSAVAKPFVLKGEEFRVTASIGISTYPQDGLDEQTLTKNADIAMYQVKEEGRNNFQFYSAKLNTNSLERLGLESSLRHALERNEFQLYYQTKLDIRSGQITGMEALLRWQHPDLGTVAPMKFLPIAEETGLIVPIGKWVLRAACLQNVIWQNQRSPRLNMAVNMSARQFFDDHLLVDLKSILADTGMDARLLELEITESLLMRDVEKTLQVLTGLREMGIQIAIDNFGIGYCSLATLKDFPIDTIKIDRSFITNIASVTEEVDLTKALIAMGRTLSKTVVAQGVETKQQAEYLRQNACDEFQGFYLNKPVPAEQITQLLRTADIDSNLAR